MTDTDSTINDVARLAGLATDQHTIRAQVPSPATSLLVERVPNDHKLEALDLERFLDEPRRPRGGVTLHDPADFAAYVNRIATPYTTVWADQGATRVVAVINDATNRDTGDDAEHGWRDHTVTLELQVDPEWTAWEYLDGELTDQATVAEHFDAYGPNVIDPDAATMLEVASSFRATASAEFESTRRDRTGDIAFRYVETTGAKAGQRDEIEVPERFVVSIAPYVGFDPVRLEAIFRYRLNQGTLRLGYRLVRPDLVLRAAFDEVRSTIVAHLEDGIAVHLGTAPGPVPATPILASR